MPAVVALGSFCFAPRVGHLEATSCSIPTHGIPHHLVVQDWLYSIYGKDQEEIPHDRPEPHGEPVRTTTNVDTNTYHDIFTGRALSGIIHLMNLTPIEWFCKKQKQLQLHLLALSLLPLNKQLSKSLTLDILLEC